MTLPALQDVVEDWTSDDALAAFARELVDVMAMTRPPEKCVWARAYVCVEYERLSARDFVNVSHLRKAVRDICAKAEIALGEDVVWGVYLENRWVDAGGLREDRGSDVRLAFEAIMDAGEVTTAYRFMRGWREAGL
jgi:hypothetical protein